MGKKKVDKPKNWPLIKNPQFCSNQATILATKSAHKMIILTKFHKDRTKIVDFLLIAKFWACILFFTHPLFLFPNDYLAKMKTWINFSFHFFAEPNNGVQTYIKNALKDQQNYQFQHFFLQKNCHFSPI